MSGTSTGGICGRLSAPFTGISKTKAAMIGAGAAAAGAAYYFGVPAAIAQCLSPKEVCTPKSCYWGLSTCMECAVPETFCRTAIDSVSGAIKEYGPTVGKGLMSFMGYGWSALEACTDAITYCERAIGIATEATDGIVAMVAKKLIGVGTAIGVGVGAGVAWARLRPTRS